MLVQADCIAKAWDSNEAIMYEPGSGPIPGGLYEIDADNVALTSMLTVGGKYVFQYEGHTGGPSKTAKPGVAPVTALPVAARKSDNRKVPMSEERKAKLRKALADARAAKKARLEAA